MFSEKFTVSDKYSLVEKKYISTSETMPWRYTSLYDEQYLPNLPESVADKLNLFFRYRFLHNTHNLEDSNKNLIIEHIDGNILSYEIINLFPYNIISQSRFPWKHFISSTECEEIDLCRDRIEVMTDETDLLSTDIVGILYNTDASFNSISIFDRRYNLSEYQNSALQKLNDFVKENYNEFRGIIYFSPTTNDLKFKMMVNFPTVDIYYDSDSVVPGDGTAEDLMVVPHTNKEHREIYIPYLVENNIITQEQADYMNEKLTGNSRFDLDFIVNDAGDVTDIHLHHIKIYEFENLEGA